jgi:hypothetical protein
LAIDSGPEGPFLWGTFEFVEPELGGVRFLGLTLTVTGPGRLAVTAGWRDILVIGPDKAQHLSNTEGLDALLSLYVNNTLLASDSAHRYRAVVILEIGRALRIHGHGGTLLVASGYRPGDDIPEGIPIEHIKYEVSELGRALLSDTTARQEALISNPYPMSGQGNAEMADALRRDSHRSLRTAILQIARLGSVDGAILLNERLELIGFGVFISTADLDNVSISLKDGLNLSGDATEHQAKKLGGARHQSAISFVDQYPGRAIAIVASQDGNLTLVGKDPDQLVALRVSAGRGAEERPVAAAAGEQDP